MKAINLAFCALLIVLLVPAWLYLGAINNAIVGGMIFAFASLFVAGVLLKIAEGRHIQESIDRRMFKGDLRNIA